MKSKHNRQELSYYGLLLLSYLQESHPDKTNDLQFIKSRADIAAETYSNAIKDGSLHDRAEEIAVKLCIQDCCSLNSIQSVISSLKNSPISPKAMFFKKPCHCSRTVKKSLQNTHYMMSLLIQRNTTGFIRNWLD